MPTTTTTTTTTTAAEEGVPPTTTTTTTTVTETHALARATARASIVIKARKEKVLPYIQFDTLASIPGSPLESLVSIEYTDGNNIGSVRKIVGKPGGPFEGKLINETCICNRDGHTYAHDYIAPYGTPAFPFDFELAGGQCTFAVDEIDQSSCIVSWCGQYQTSDPVAARAALEEGFIKPTMAFLKEKIENGAPTTGTIHTVTLDSPALQKIDLTGKVVMITGASRGFGEMTARHLAAKGAKVVLTARSVPAMEKIVAEIKAAGGEAACCKLDLTKEEDHIAAFKFAKETYGPVEFYFANGGTGGLEENGLKSLHELDKAGIDVTIDCNYVAVLLGFRYAFDHFNENGGGAFVINASYTSALSAATHGIFVPPGSDFGGSLGIYTSTKAAVTDLARSLAGAYGAKGIRFYSVNPAFFETALVKDGGKQYMPDMPEETKFSDIWGLNNPVMVGSGGDPNDIAAFVEACFDGSTLWPSGSAVVIDNDLTFSLHQLNKDVDAPGSASGFNVDLNELKTLTGAPISAEKLEAVKEQRAKGFAIRASLGM